MLTYSICTTCKGRLEHLKLTLPVSLAHDDIETVLVDYACPQGSGQWAEQTFAAQIRSGRLRVLYVPGRDDFHVAHAKNVAHVRAQGQILINADADNYIDDNFIRLCDEIFANPTVQLARSEGWSETAKSGMIGRIVMRRDLFFRLGGYDEDMYGWGAEDHDIASRAQRMGYTAAEIPHAAIKVIEHENELRAAYYRIKDIEQSAQLNDRLSIENLKQGRYVANRDRTIGAISIITQA